MAKKITKFICSNCGTSHAKWVGQCENCHEWNTLVQENIENIPKGLGHAKGTQIEFLGLKGKMDVAPRIISNVKEFDRVCGGGVVLGSAILVGGDPGIGKSTLLLQLVSQVSTKARCIYISGEESIDQVRIRATRLGLIEREISLASATNVRDIISTLEKDNDVGLVVIDSIQTMYVDTLDSAPGTVSQVRTSAQELIRVAKRNNFTLLLVGHVTKEGAIAGPRVLEHIVDTVLYFEGDLSHQFRILRAIKNRFGPTDEIGVFEMTHSGLIEVENPSALFLGQRRGKTSGAAVFAGIEGSRTILVEIEALVVPSTFGTPRSAVVGWDTGRLAVILAVLEARCGLQFGNHDVYLNVAGGLRISEPAADLAVAAALISALKDEPITSETVIFGEIGLSGEVRPVGQMDLRFKEAQKLGFTNAYFPGHHQNQKNSVNRSIKTKEIRHIADLICLFSITSSKRDKSSGML